ncbi:MAG: methylamine utilization protein MauJ [Burkholderiales bacterium]
MAAGGGGSHPHGIGKGAGARLINPNFTADYLPAPKEPKAKLALALYREALSVNSVAYQFLGFAKVLNILYEKGKDQVAWINKNVDQVTDHRAKERLAELHKQGVDVGDYLYTSGRCAIAHAYATPVVDPEDPEENRRLHRDLSLIQALAEDLIERELDIKSAQTVWREHLYELGGFRLVIGDEAAERIKNLQPLDMRKTRVWPRPSIRIREKPIFPALDKLKVMQSLIIGNGGVTLKSESEDGLVHTELFLDFKNERLVMGPEGKVQIKDDGSPAVIRHMIDCMRFRKFYYLNGELEVYDADHETLLAVC